LRRLSQFSSPIDILLFAFLVLFSDPFIMRFSPFVTPMLPLFAFAALPDIGNGTPFNAAYNQVLNDTLKVNNALNATLFRTFRFEDPPQKAVARAVYEAQGNTGFMGLAVIKIVTRIANGTEPREAEYVDNPQWHRRVYEESIKLTSCLFWQSTGGRK
jgi:hypothetical protein